ncbi:hypothetical protein DL96DRAFT_1587079 [Flagelloscypha sp. PMI_526]|nr:hypothetical protein DL96DRAFT_1587079 [Flagelloscypha sp. PMI_526]
MALLAGTHQACLTACTAALALLGPSKVAFVGSNDFQEAVLGPRNQFNRVQTPACVVHPTTTEDVSATMKLIFKSKANYAVQSGGHQANIAWNNVDGGVLISFSHMAGVSYNSATQTATLQPGSRAGDVLLALSPYGVAVAGARTADIGTGGLLIGGGYSHLSPQVGHSVDMLKEADVVLVDGTVVTATTTNKYKDLLQALKGGGDRFGIVTRFVVDVVKTGTKDDKTWYGGVIQFPGNQSQALMAATAHYTRNIADPKASLMSVIGDVWANGTIPIASVYLFYNGNAFPKGIFDEFLAIPATSTKLGPLSYYEVATLAAFDSAVVGHAVTASVLAGNAPMSDFTKTLDSLATFWSTAGPHLGSAVYALTPIPQSQIAAGRKKGSGNAIAPPDGNYLAIALSQSYAAGVNVPSTIVQDAANKWASTTPRTSGKPMYVNEAGAEQNVLATYGDYSWLKQTYAKYDPTRFSVGYSRGPAGL